MKRFLMVIFAISLVVNISFADDGVLFIQKCGKCHKNNTGIRSFTPARYSSAQWMRFFEKNKHQRKKDISHLVTQQELDTIKLYLIAHSKDSPEPDVVGFSQDRYVWKGGTLAPKNMGWAKLYREIIFPVFEMVTDGNITVKIYWGDVIGDDLSVIKKLDSGELDVGGLSGFGTSILCPEMSLLGLPFLFNTNGEIDYIKQKMAPMFDSFLNKRGYKLLLWTDQGFDQIYSRKPEISKVKHFSNCLFGSWFGPMEEIFLKKLGAKVTCPDNDRNVYTLIRQNEFVDVFIAPAMFVLSTNIFSEIKYINQNKIRYAPAIVVLRNDSWHAISPSYQKRITGHFQQYVEREFSEAVRRDNQRAINAMVKYGIQDVTFSSTDLKAIKEIARSVWFELADNIYPKEVLTELLNHLETYRSQLRAK